MSRAYIQERIDKTKLLIAAYEDAALALVNGGIQSYTIDTGQTRQTVTRESVATLNAQIDVLYNRIATLEARLGQGNTTRVRPAW